MSRYVVDQSALQIPSSSACLSYLACVLSNVIAAGKIWKNDKIEITPHIASITNEEAAVPQILDNYNRMIKNIELRNVIDLENEY